CQRYLAHAVRVAGALRLVWAQAAGGSGRPPRTHTEGRRMIAHHQIVLTAALLSLVGQGSAAVARGSQVSRDPLEFRALRATKAPNSLGDVRSGCTPGPPT